MECKHEETSKVELAGHQDGIINRIWFTTCLKCGDTVLSIQKLCGDNTVQKQFRLTPLEA